MQNTNTIQMHAKYNIHLYIEQNQLVIKHYNTHTNHYYTRSTKYKLRGKVPDRRSYGILFHHWEAFNQKEYCAYDKWYCGGCQ